MFAFSFLYPRPKTRLFDYEHHRHVHMTMGIGLTEQYLGIRPKMFWIERIDEGVSESTERYAAIVHVLFENERDLEKFTTLSSFEEAVRKLSDDYANYTDAPPEIRISRWTLNDDMEALIADYSSH